MQNIMKEAIIHPGPRVELIESPIPRPGPSQVLIQVIYSGSNPKDWKVPELLNRPLNEGDDIAGIVEEVGAQVHEFKKGNRVAGFHAMSTPGGSYAEYAIAEAHTTFHLPEKTSFEEAATIPLAAMTAAIGMYAKLNLPEPWKKPSKGFVGTPLLVYGGATAVGAFTIKLARKSGIHPIIAVAGRGAPFVESLLDSGKGDTVIDYREGDASVVEEVKRALGGRKLLYAFDAVSERSSFDNILEVLEPEGKVTYVLPKNGVDKAPFDGDTGFTNVGVAHGKLSDFAYLWFKYMAKGLQDGWFSGHPLEVVPGGLNGLESALKDLKAGKASAVKYVFKIEETQ
ncbi:groES-like protein [Colletotrichum tofieldiae]|nr:GroES-like protein [Colletotrichum tofieldiae]GKT72178.1 groES-like protein [Colletotrichum tofieldiae]GKT90013.1 groES-like protein [Colletotrichum tofieldiae]